MLLCNHQYELRIFRGFSRDVKLIFKLMLHTYNKTNMMLKKYFACMFLSVLVTCKSKRLNRSGKTFLLDFTRSPGSSIDGKDLKNVPKIIFYIIINNTDNIIFNIIINNTDNIIFNNIINNTDNIISFFL